MHERGRLCNNVIVHINVVNTCMESVWSSTSLESEFAKGQFVPSNLVMALPVNKMVARPAGHASTVLCHVDVAIVVPIVRLVIGPHAIVDQV